VRVSFFEFPSLSIKSAYTASIKLRVFLTAFMIAFQWAGARYLVPFGPGSSRPLAASISEEDSPYSASCATFSFLVAALASEEELRISAFCSARAIT
jgi:hypothetical protein